MFSHHRTTTRITNGKERMDVKERMDGKERIDGKERMDDKERMDGSMGPYQCLIADIEVERR